MGEVYRARDAKLGRDVALKILPDSVAQDVDRVARFKREAQVLAALNHPHVAAIYGFDEAPSSGSGQAGTTQFLVLELVEGETLADRLKRGPIPVDETIAIACQMAEALAAAHEKGIIHRDLKPANIALNGHDQVKVLDFGLAKLVAAPAAAASSSVSMSPTLTTPAMMTGVGMILGTAAYMAPEQAKGRDADKRCDLWAFGCVVYEMLTAKRAFEGEDITDTIASIMRGEPDWTALPTGTPAHLRRMLATCLTKDRTRRAADIAVVQFLLRDDAIAATVPATLHVTHRPMWWRALPWMVAALFAVSLTSALLTWSPWRAPASAPPRKLLASIGADASLPTNLGASAVLSPDGTTLVFAGEQGRQTRLFVRKLDQLQATPIAGTEDAANPFFSPDGQWIGFFASGRLKKVSVSGGAPIVLCGVAAGRGATWADDDAIIFSPTGAPGAALLRVSASGGAPAAFGVLGTGATTQRWPQALPDGKGVLYTEHSSTGAFNRANLVVGPLTGGPAKIVVRGGYFGRYAPSGHLLFMQQGTLFAVRFDLDRLETVGTPVSALDALVASPERGGAQLAFSSEGTLVYVPGIVVNVESPVDWMTSDGTASVLRSAKSDWANPRFSPGGDKLAMDIADGNHRNIWVYDIRRETLTQLTFGEGQEQRPAWTPDGRHIVFASDRDHPGTLNIYWTNADGTGAVTRLTDSSESQVPYSWHPSGRFLAFHVLRVATLGDLMILPMDGDAARGWTPGKPTTFLETAAGEGSPMFSPDGRWIAYTLAEAGVGYGSGNGNGADVYVRPFPGPGGPWRVSTEGGGFPHWSASTHELLFVDPGQNIVMAAPYTVVGDSFQVDKPHVWSPTAIRPTTGAYPYDIHPDGKRLAVAPAGQRAAVQDKVVFVFNFFDYLRKIAPGKR
jgi:serine/threonine protein kinase/Tol biopolymer transport system component